VTKAAIGIAKVRDDKIQVVECDLLETLIASAADANQVSLHMSAFDRHHGVIDQRRLAMSPAAASRH